MVKAEMSEVGRDEVTVAPTQDQGTGGRGGGRLAEPSVLTWATLTDCPCRLWMLCQILRP